MVRHYVFSVLVQSLSNLKKKINQEIAVVSTEYLEKVWKYTNYKTNRIIIVNGCHIEQNEIGIEPLEYVCFNIY